MNSSLTASPAIEAPLNKGARSEILWLKVSGERVTWHSALKYRYLRELRQPGGNIDLRGLVS